MSERIIGCRGSLSVVSPHAGLHRPYTGRRRNTEETTALLHGAQSLVAVRIVHGIVAVDYLSFSCDDDAKVWERVIDVMVFFMRKTSSEIERISPGQTSAYRGGDPFLETSVSRTKRTAVGRRVRVCVWGGRKEKK